MKRQINRRYFLKGSGVCLSLPLFETFSITKKQSQPPTRLVYLGYIYGVTKDNNWFPAETGQSYKITPGLQPLAKHHKDFTVFSNIGNSHAKDSHYSCTTLFTGADLKRTPGRAFHNSISCDQVAAQQLGKNTRFNSIEIGGPEGGAGPGLSLSWDQAGKPLPGFSDPVELFNHMYGDGKVSKEERRQQIKKKRSILDAVNEESKSIHRVVSKADKDKLDEYFQSIRQIEVRLQKATDWLNIPKPKAPLKSPIPGLKGDEQIKIMYDLIIAGMHTDSTRVFSYMQPLRTLLQGNKIKFSGHQLSHHKIEEADSKNASIARDSKHSELLCYFIDRLKSTKEFDGSSLFENSVVIHSSGVRHGHMLRNIPTIVTGLGGNKLKHKGYLELKDGHNKMSNLCLTSLKAAGIKADTFSDSSGIIEEIWA